jgi:hypothetical protein
MQHMFANERHIIDRNMIVFVMTFMHTKLSIKYTEPKCSNTSESSSEISVTYKENNISLHRYHNKYFLEFLIHFLDYHAHLNRKTHNLYIGG